MNQRKWLLCSALVLCAARLVWYYYAGWGLITIHADKQPLFKIVNQIERQGHVTLKTDLPPNTPVSMQVDRVPVSEALETLSVVTESRWRLNYFLAPDRVTLRAGINAMTAGNLPDGWKTIYHPFPQMMFLSDSGVIPDPRNDLWTTRAPAENTLQAWLESGARMAGVGFSLPENWNPAIPSAPGPGRVANAVPKLAKAARGQVEPMFLLTKNQRRSPRGADDGQQRPPPDGDTNPQLNFDWMAERAQAEIKKLPAADQAAALAQVDAERQFRESLRNLSPEDRRAKMEEHMNDPKVQEQMDKRQAQRDARSTPEQRSQRYQRYVDQKAALKQK